MKLKQLLLAFLLVFCFDAFSQSAKKTVKQAKKDLKAKNYQAAIDGYTKALELKPGNYGYILTRAGIYERYGKPAEALKDYQQALEIKPKDYKIIMKAGDLSAKLKDYKSAAMYYDRNVATDRHDIVSLQKSSYAHLNIKDFALALERANEAYEEQRYNHLSLYYRALALDSLKQYTEANIAYTSAIKLMRNIYKPDEKADAQFKPYYANHALILYRLGDNDNAIKEYNLATASDPKDTVEPAAYYVYFLESQPYVKKTDFTNSIGYLNKTLAINPSFADGFAARASVNKQTSQFQSAISDYTKVIQLTTNNASAYFGRGQSHLELGNYTEAIADLKKAAELDPANEQIKNLLRDASDKNYKANKENEVPVLVIMYPLADNGGFVNIYENQQDILIEGQVSDKSLISEININGKTIRFNAGDKNPLFTYKLNAKDVNRIDISVSDIYFNTTSKSLKVGRIIDNSRSRVDFSGRVSSDDNRHLPYANRIVYITNEKGEALYQAKTDALGNFKFEKLPFDKKYLMTLDTEDAQFNGIEKFAVTDSKGNVVMVTHRNTMGKFNFELLPSDLALMSLMTVEDAPLKLDVKGRLVADDEHKTPLASIKFLLLNERDEISAFHITNNDGSFTFPGLMPSDKYNFAIDVLDSKKIPYNKIFVTDENGKIVKTIVKNADGIFKFKLLESERAMLSTLAAEDFDPWAHLKLSQQKKEVEIIENIYYESGSFKLSPAAEKILDKAVIALKNDPNLLLEVQSHTDATAGDEYNMDLSQKRANASVDYIVSKGIDRKRLTAKGFGETQLTNRCSNGVDCSDEEHRQNRRTVFKLSYK